LDRPTPAIILLVLTTLAFISAFLLPGRDEELAHEKEMLDAAKS